MPNARSTVARVDIHKPIAELDYGLDWNGSGWLDESPGDAIGEAEWTLEPTQVDEEDEAEIFNTVIDGVFTTAWIRHLTPGSNYYLTCVVTLTPSGRIDERSIHFRCRY